MLNRICQTLKKETTQARGTGAWTPLSNSVLKSSRHRWSFPVRSLRRGLNICDNTLCTLHIFTYRLRHSYDMTCPHFTSRHTTSQCKLMNFRCECEYVLPSSSHENVTDAFHSATSSNAFRSSYFGSSGSSGSTLALLTITSSVIAVIFLRPLLFGTPATPCPASTGSKSNLHFDYIKESF